MAAQSAAYIYALLIGVAGYYLINKYLVPKAEEKREDESANEVKRPAAKAKKVPLTEILAELEPEATSSLSTEPVGRKKGKKATAPAVSAPAAKKMTAAPKSEKKLPSKPSSSIIPAKDTVKAEAEAKWSAMPYKDRQAADLSFIRLDAKLKDQIAELRKLRQAQKRKILEKNIWAAIDTNDNEDDEEIFNADEKLAAQIDALRTMHTLTRIEKLPALIDKVTQLVAFESGRGLTRLVAKPVVFDDDEAAGQQAEQKQLTEEEFLSEAAGATWSKVKGPNKKKKAKPQPNFPSAADTQATSSHGYTFEDYDTPATVNTLTGEKSSEGKKKGRAQQPYIPGLVYVDKPTKRSKRRADLGSLIRSAEWPG